MLGPLICLLKITTRLVVLSCLAKWTEMGKSLGSQPCVLVGAGGGQGTRTPFYLFSDEWNLHMWSWGAGDTLLEDQPGRGLFNIPSLKRDPCGWAVQTCMVVDGARTRSPTRLQWVTLWKTGNMNGIRWESDSSGVWDGSFVSVFKD